MLTQKPSDDQWFIKEIGISRWIPWIMITIISDIERNHPRYTLIIRFSALSIFFCECRIRTSPAVWSVRDHDRISPLHQQSWGQGHGIQDYAKALRWPGVVPPRSLPPIGAPLPPISLSWISLLTTCLFVIWSYLCINIIYLHYSPQLITGR